MNKNTKNQSLWAQAISLITYKDEPEPYSFTLPENAENAQSTAKDPDNNGNSESNAQSSSQSSGKKAAKPLKKPSSPAELKSGRAAGKAADSDEVSTQIEVNIQILKKQFGLPENKDLIIRHFMTGGRRRAFIAYLDGMTNTEIINNFILRPLLNETGDDASLVSRGILPLENIIQTNDTKRITQIPALVTEILKGNTALYVDGLDHFIACESIGYEKRGVEAPKTEGIVKGPQEAFGESLRTNVALIRRIVRNKDLITEFYEIGEKSNTTVAMVYLKTVVNPAIVNEVKRRLSHIKTDFLVSAGMLEQLIEDNPYSIIPTILSTERPDRCAAHLVEGRVSIIVDGTPFAMIVPVTMHALMHSPEDASLKWQYATGLRMIRFIALLLAMMLPGLYIAMTTFHREMIPTDLLIAIAKAKENVPFPTLVEILLMEIGFELIREAGIRIPGIIGNTLGIIGALILGEAAVSANIVSPILIIVVALTGLSNFAIPNYSLAFGARITRFYFIFAGATLGFYGIGLAIVAYILMLANMKTFGINFLSVLSPRTKRSRDIFFRWPVWTQEQRPDYLGTPDRNRQPKIARQWAKQTKDNV